MKSSFQPSIFILSAALALLAGCVETQGPDYPAAPQNKLGESVSYVSEHPREQSPKVRLIAKELGIEKLYAAPISAKSPRVIDAPGLLDRTLSVLPHEALKHLLTKGAVMVSSATLVGTLTKLTSPDAPGGMSTSWLISIKPTWGCIKACWEDGPISTCTGCCGDKDDNIKIKMYRW